MPFLKWKAKLLHLKKSAHYILIKMKETAEAYLAKRSRKPSSLFLPILTTHSASRQKMQAASQVLNVKPYHS